MDKLLVLLWLFIFINLDAQDHDRLLEWNEPKPGQSASFPFYSESDTYVSFLGPHKFFVERLAMDLMRFDSFIFSIEYYSDCRGDSAFNRANTKRQADSAIVYMQGKAGNHLHLIAVGYGEDSLLNNCSCEKDKPYTPCNEAQHQENRRLVVRITGIWKD